jgi:uncharacterized cupin superfamily protein
MAKIDIAGAVQTEGSDYPAPFDAPCRNRIRRAIGDVAGLSQFGVNLLGLAPGAWSSQRHWHTEEDEFAWVLKGEVVLVTGTGEEVLQAGECVGFKVGLADGHHLQNRSDQAALILEVGSRKPKVDAADYPDIDLRWDPSGRYTHKDGTPY